MGKVKISIWLEENEFKTMKDMTDWILIAQLFNNCYQRGDWEENLE